MSYPISQENIKLFSATFRGREDVFAIRWEKGNKGGYMPAYSFDPYMYRLHRMRGGTFQNYTNKQYLPLTDEQIHKHLKGEQLIGIYPLLKDNTTWFIAADFDGENWEKECKNCIAVCFENGLPAYLERSRSGKGGHVWIFFEHPYPAFRIRKIFITLMERNGVFSVFDKHSSFDRLFPNQDYHSGKGLGNLIALPLHKPTYENGNSCFINPDTLLPIEDQWELLKNIQKITVETLDTLYQDLIHKEDSKFLNKTTPDNGRVSFILRNVVSISRSGLSVPLITYLREELNFANSEYFIKKKIGKNTWDTKRFFKTIEETTDDITIPRGFVGKLIRFCKEHDIDYNFSDERRKAATVIFSNSIQLRDYQKPALEAVAKKDLGVIVAPSGSGKTIIGLSIVANKQHSALIVVHRKQLAEQWVERIESFLGIPKREMGKIAQGKIKIGKQITVATIQSLNIAMQSSEAEQLSKSFGTVIVDECHHIPAETFRNTISKFHSFYMYGLTATPFRKYNDGKLIFIHLGEIIAEIKPHTSEIELRARIVVRNTQLLVPFNPKTDKFETLSKILIHDSARNKLILDDVVSELNNGKKTIIITERKEHIESLYQYLKQKYEAITLSGEDSESDKNYKWKNLREGNFQVLITTGQFFGEGTDLQKAECLFLVYPFSFEGKLVQYIGRVQRSEIMPVIYDYRDYKIEYMEKLFKKRNAYYQKLYPQDTLFNQPESQNSTGTFVYEKRVSIPITQLEFRFGIIALKHIIPPTNIEIEFEVENDAIRPEFAVLKPYFTRILKTKKVKVDVQVTFHNGNPLYQKASSYDLDKINKEIIESVKFQFITKSIIGNNPKNEGNLLTINQFQDDHSKLHLYNSEAELLNDILKNKNVKHYRQLVYLSQKHEFNILKLRFVLDPFSFVFFLIGRRQYHIVWETLDTEEATYVWHVDKNNSSLRNRLKQIDSDLRIIRAKGRQHYLELQPDNFSRIVHDYSDDRKSFILWKDILEERLL